MKYDNIIEGIFLDRPNRFIANVSINGIEEVCHVKNTGRCKELLTAQSRVLVNKACNPNRKTLYDLVSVYKGNMLVNMDSQAPNQVFLEWLRQTDYFGKITLIKPETTYNKSRLDFYVETDKSRIFIEVKGVTLENNGIVSFPDAPTQRGLKHINELVQATKEGYECYIFFVIQMEHCLYFTPNSTNHLEFSKALTEASKQGVNVRAVNCNVTKNSLSIHNFVEVKLL